MKGKKILIEIPAPCPASWEQMDKGKTGRFCQQCDKRVHDLTQLSDKAAVAFLLERPGVCARLRASQLDVAISVAESTHSSLPQMMAGLGIAASVFLAAPWVRAQTVQQQTEQTAAPKAGSKGSLSGRIAIDNLPLKVVRVQLFKDNALQREVITNESGHYLFSPLAAGNYWLQINGGDEYSIRTEEIKVNNATRFDVNSFPVRDLKPFEIEDFYTGSPSLTIIQPVCDSVKQAMKKLWPVKIRLAK